MVAYARRSIPVLPELSRIPRSVRSMSGKHVYLVWSLSIYLLNFNYLLIHLSLFIVVVVLFCCLFFVVVFCLLACFLLMFFFFFLLIFFVRVFSSPEPKAQGEVL